MKLFKKGKASKRTSKDFHQERRYILNKRSDFYTKEAYKSLRTNIIFSIPSESCRKVCVTSAVAGEGKSITVLNLAISFAETGQRVLLIDGDLRRPNQSRLLERKASPGLSNALAGLNTDEEIIHKDVFPHLDVIFSGDIPPNPSELLGHQRMEQLLERLSADYDYIFIDTPPVNVVTDASVLSRMLDGVLFVVRRNESDSDSVLYAVSQLEFAEAKLLGFILNGAELGGSTRYGSGKYKKYKKYGYKSGGYGYGYGYREHRTENVKDDAP